MVGRLAAILIVVLAACGPSDEESWATITSHETGVWLTAVQFDAVPLEAERNRDAMERLLREACRGEGPRIVLFHENALLDYGPGVRELAERVPEGPTCVRFEALARELEVWVGIGLVERAGTDEAPRFHLTQAYFGPEGYVGRYRKTWLFHNRTSPMFDEWALFDPGEGPDEVLELAGLRTATLICADAESRRCVERVAALEPDLVLFPNNRSELHQPESFAHLARRIGAPVLAANRSGRRGPERVLCNGGSFLLAADGSTHARAKRKGDEQVLSCRLP